MTVTIIYRMTTTRVPVLIVGAGAGGLATSALLAKHGIRPLLVERRRETFIYPKARNLSFRSLEILRGLGLADEVHAVADHVSAMMVKPALNSAEEKPAIDIDAVFAGLDALSPEPAAQYCPQSRLEPILLAETRRRGGEVRYGMELVSLQQDASGVTAVVRERDSGRSETVRADYLVGADGVHSPIRNWLGITTSGYGALPIYVVFIYFRAPWRKFVADLADGDAVQVKSADVDGIFLVVEGDLGMFITTYFPAKGETADQFTPQRCRDLLTKAMGEPTDIDIIDVAAWQPYEQVADQFSCGRAFLVGDSAHTMPPFKAGGANTAIQSAHNSGLEARRRVGRDRRSRFVGDLPRRAPPGGAVRGPPVADRPDACRAPAQRRPATTAGRGRMLDVRVAHRIPLPLGGRSERPGGAGHGPTGGGVARAARHPGSACVGARRCVDTRPAGPGVHRVDRRRALVCRCGFGVGSRAARL